MAALIAKAAGMSDEECDLLLNAAPMHDIGKIGIPDHILLKPGKFEPDEWEIMKTHAQIGADILAGDDTLLLNMASDIALTHHEKWDGSGYPNGLKGDEIPLVGRITALADVFDALTSVRPYKKAWSIDDAVALIKDESGKQFEPALVDHFLSILDAMIEIKEKYAEPGVEGGAVGLSAAS
jgi:putative two-component system response regulator